MRLWPLLGLVVVLLLIWFGWGAAQAPAIDQPVVSGTAPLSVPGVVFEPTATDGDPGEGSVGNAREPVIATTGFSGRVLRAGEAVGGIHVTAQATTGTIRAEATTTTGADGAFLLATSPGVHALRIHGPGVSRRGLGSVRVTAGQTFVLGGVDLQQPIAVRGRVIDEHGVPLAGARVFAAMAPPGVRDPFRLDQVDPDPDEVPNMITGADGRFLLRGLRPGPVAVRAEQSDHRAWSETVQAEAAVVAEVGDLVLLRQAPLQGVVVDRDGGAVAGAMVMPGGGRYQAVHVRQAVRTAADGTFELRGFGRQTELLVTCAGYEPVEFERPEEIDRVRIQMSPAKPLTGVVVGGEGKAGELQLRLPERDFRAVPNWATPVIWGRHPIAADGTFAIPAVPAGVYVVHAEIPGVGDSASREVDIPMARPLQLQIVAGLPHAVDVVDELGAPVRGAVVGFVPLASLPPAERSPTRPAVVHGGPTRGEQSTDADGRVRLVLPPGQHVQIEARAPLHWRASAVHARDQLPANTRLILSRCGTVRVAVADDSLRSQVRMVVQGTCSGVAGFSGAVDRAGWFSSGPVPPGRYRVELLLLDATTHGEHELPVAAPIPWVGDHESMCEPVDVDVRIGIETVVQLRPMPAAEVSVRVTAGSLPVAGAVVFARMADGKDAYRTEQDPNLFVQYPHGRTSSDGMVRLRMARPGHCELQARHPHGADWSAAYPWTVRAPAERSHLTIVLGGGSIRGSWDLAPVPPAERVFLEARLYRRQDAGLDPRAQHHGQFGLYTNVQAESLRVTGEFTFAGLGAGPWVLRITDRFHTVLAQRVVMLDGDDAIDLGCLRPASGVRPRLSCGLPENLAVQVSAIHAESGLDVFVATVPGVHDGERGWPELPAGRYRLQAVRDAGEGDWMMMATVWAAVGAPVEVVIAADGTCAPARVWPDGLPAAGK